MDPRVDQYLIDGCMRCKFGGTPQCKVNDWRAELELLRQIVNETELKEELKWGVPCYTRNSKNILNISALRDAATIGFYKGALLDDPVGLLQKPGENSQAVRYIKFTSLQEVADNKAHIIHYITQAIAVEKEGKKIEFKKTPEPMPEELIQALEEIPALKKAFEALTPGRQRGYILYFSQPKQSQTRRGRIDKCTEKIMKGEGLHDR